MGPLLGNVRFTPESGHCPHSRRQLLANAVIAASRVGKSTPELVLTASTPNRALGVPDRLKYFVMVPESGIKRRPNPNGAKMDMHRGGIGEARYAYAPRRSSAVFCFGRMGQWNGDRDCEPANKLTIAARGTSSAYRAQKPRPGRSEAGFCYEM
jgi:hypothetical protein